MSGTSCGGIRGAGDGFLPKQDTGRIFADSFHRGDRHVKHEFANEQLTRSFCGLKRMARGPLAVSAASGGIGGLVLQALVDFIRNDSSVIAVAPPEPFLPPASLSFTDTAAEWHWPSVALGIIVGLSVGPICEFLLDLRSIWAIWVRRQLVRLFRLPSSLAPRPLYREL